MVKGSREWKTEMMVHKSDRKINRTGSLKGVAGALNTVGIMCMVAVWACAGSFALSVQAAPATLTSSDATVYEQADEGSSQVGNLVEGSTFEYIGDVTSADGSVWHQITTASGVNGYIRGDREMEIGAEESVPEESEGVPVENVPADGGEGAGGNTGEAPEVNDGEDEEISEESEDLEDNNAVVAVMNMQNNQQKKYVLDPSGKIKEREILAEPNADVRNGKSIKAEIDMTLFTGIIVVLFCAVAVGICLTRMKVFTGVTDGGEMQGAGRNKVHKKIEKKKRSPKRKGKKSVRFPKK